MYPPLIPADMGQTPETDLSQILHATVDLRCKLTRRTRQI